MALLTIVLGLLLAGGGGFFVILGFDIVMTDRGAAMTIAGTVALSGGIVTLAIGFTILRLSHILRAIEQAAKAAPRPARGVEAAAPAAAEIPAPTPLPTAAIVGGGALAAGAAVLAAGAKGEPAVAAPLADVDPVLAEHAAAMTSADAVEAPDDATTGSAELDMPEEDNANISEDETPDAPVLMDGDATADTQAVKAATSEPLLDDDIFADLNEMLRSDAPTAVNAQADPSLPDLADQSGSNEADLSVDDAEEQSESVPVTAPGPASDHMDRAPSASFSSLLAASREDGPKVLGSYNAGGRTYTMYSDGSVEAVTENGVERFSSMESLRQHLART